MEEDTHCQSVCIWLLCCSELRKATWQVLQVNGWLDKSVAAVEAAGRAPAVVFSDRTEVIVMLGCLSLPSLISPYPPFLFSPGSSPLSLQSFLSRLKSNGKKTLRIASTLP